MSNQNDGEVLTREVPSISLPQHGAYTGQLDEDDTKLLIQMWNEGVSGSAIGRHFEVSRSVIAGKVSRLREAGVDLFARVAGPGPQPGSARSKRAAAHARAVERGKERVARRAALQVPLASEAPPVRRQTIPRHIWGGAQVPKHAPRLIPVTASATEAVGALRLDDCRYPIGELNEPGFRFCCEPIAEGHKSYCRKHQRICCQPVQRRVYNRPNYR